MKPHAISVLLILALLLGCAEGGTGGTGGLVPPPQPTTVGISGQANKGPFAEGAFVTVSQLDETGETVSTQTSATLGAGRYDLSVLEDSVSLISVEGRYFSEATGEFSSEEIEILGVFAGTEDDQANVNVLTHLIHDRVLQLMADGTSAQVAIDMAEDEIILALSGVIPSPASDVRFTDLVVLNVLQEDPTEEGNGYLLALSSIFEQYAITLSEGSGTSASVELANVLDSISADLAEDGMLVLAEEPALLAAQQSLNPNEIHQHLFEFDADFKDQAIAELDTAPSQESSELDCRVNLDRLACFVSDETVSSVADLETVGSVSLSNIVADMNLFIDSDGDGLVNADDDDDDGDGIDDESDPAPFDAALLVPALSASQFAAYIKDGLRQWSGVVDNSETLLAQSSPFQDAVAVPAAESAEARDVIAAVSADSTVLSASTFTKTNLLVTGVEEIDPVKYDGEHLYVANGADIQVLKTYTDGTAAEVLGRINVNSGSESSNQSIRGIYLSDDSSLLTAISEAQAVHWFVEWFSPWGWNGKTRIDLVDISDVTVLTKTNSLELDGSYITSRRIGNVLYVVTRFTPSLAGLVLNAESEEEIDANERLIEELDVNELLPQVRYQDGTSGNLVTSDNCFLPPITDVGPAVYYPTLTTITAIKLDNPSDMTSVCLTDGIQGMHMSLNAIYLAALDRDFLNNAGFYDNTLIHKFSITNETPAYVGSARVAGSFWGDPNFLMGEHNGNLTLITTRRTKDDRGFEHRLTILGESAGSDFTLRQLGQIPNDSTDGTIGKPGEQIFASRILGDRAYIVTFERVDPVYVIDLSDPARPEIVGELEIPGFSTYLHPVSDSLLLGIGRNTTDVDGQPFFQGINVRLFDVTDGAQLKVLSDITIGRRGTETPVAWDPHAFTILSDVDAGTHRFTVPVRVHGQHIVENPNLAPWRYYPWTHEALYLFEIDEGERRVIQAGRVIADDFDSGYRFAADCCAWSERSFLNGDTIHYLRNNRLHTAMWGTPDSVQHVFIPTVFASDAPIFCTLELRDGLSVTVADRLTGGSLNCASVVARDGDFTATIRSGCENDSLDTVGLFERPGSYEVLATNQGYEDWLGSGIIVQADECHVRRTHVSIFLKPLP